MSTPPAPQGAAPSLPQRPGGRERGGGGDSLRARAARVWDALDANQRIAGIAAVALFVAMFLPWYSETYTVVLGSGTRSALSSTQTTLSAFQAFSFVEAAVLLLSAGVLAMLFARAEGQPFRLPGGDGTIAMLAGAWAALLIFYRMLEKPGLHGTHRIAASVGIEWGIFFAFVFALVLAAAGSRMRAGLVPEAPRLRPAESETTVAHVQPEMGPPPRPRYPPAPSVAPVGPIARRRALAPPTTSTVRYPEHGG